MECVSPFLGWVCDGLKWAQEQIGYATNVKSEIEKLKEEMGKLNDVWADVDRKVVIARERCQHVKIQVDGWQRRVRVFKEKVAVDFELQLNCSCTVFCPNCWTRYTLGKRIVLEHKVDVAKLINEGKEYSDGTVVDPDLHSPIETNIRSTQVEAKRLWDLEADINSRVVTTKRGPLLRQVEGWIKRVSEHKKDVNAIQKDFEEMENSDNQIKLHWVQLSQRAENLLKETKELTSEGRSFEDVADPSSPVILVDPNLPSPIETNIRSIQEEAKRLSDLEADINSKVEATKRERLLLPKRQVEGWIKRVSEHKQDVTAIQKEFEEMKNSDNHIKLHWGQLSQRGENLLKEIKELRFQGRSFEDVADPSRPVILVEQAVVPTIGQDKVYTTVLDLIKNEQVRRIGIHGMEGIGKTTLLKKINNSFKGSDFELIIWVSVSKDFTIGEIQQSIMKRCGMDGKNDKPHEMESKIRDFLKGKRYVLLLDDVWKPLDLNSLGVPTGDNEVKSMILITSCFEDVCDRMQAIKVPINCLDPNEARALFRAKVGEAILASNPKIEEFAEQICLYCGGLPLALEVIGIAMSEKYTVSEWIDAKNTLEKHAPGFEDSEEKLFSRLKLSYDSLKNDTIRECFCYCALFREEWEINSDDLVWCWIGEGLFDDECDNIDAARDKGYTIIRDLIKATLLKEVEDGKDETSAILNKMINEWKVVMHDVLRDMVLWIRKDEFKISEGRSGFGKISGKEARLGLTFGEGDSMERLQKELLQFGKSAPNLSTLITTAKGATLFTDDMLEAMNKLRVLHVYGWYNCTLPRSVGRLRDLRCLNLFGNTTLASLEVLRELGSLRLLIINVPYELSFERVISRLSRLQALILGGCFRTTGVESAGISISELESLPCLEDLQLSICTAPFLKGLAQSPKLARCVSDLQIMKTDISCFRLIQEVGSMDRIKSLRIDDSEMTEVVIEEEQGCKPNTLCNLSLLYFVALNKLIEFRVSMEPKNSLQYLKFIRIDSCYRLRFAYLGWPLPQLEFLMVEKCSELEEIFKIWGGSGIVFSALRIILIRECRMLKIICSDAFCFPSLQMLEVKRCEQLKRLPTGVIQASKESLKEIRGSQRWWDELTWDSVEDKISLLPLFKAKFD